jgi:hypothetical protein
VRPRTPVGLVVVLACVGCGRDPVTPQLPSSDIGGEGSVSAPDSSAGVPGTTDLHLIVRLPVIGFVGQEVSGSAMLYPGTYDGPWYLDTEVSWTISDTSIARLDSGMSQTTMGLARSVRVTIVGPGVVTLTASAEGIAGSTVLRAIESDPPLSDQLEIESFTLGESFTGGTRATYVPRATLRSRSGDAVQVFGVQFLIPGLGPIPYCWTLRGVPPGQSFELFRIVHGDYELEIVGERAVGPGTMVIYLFDRAGNPGKVAATATITEGTPAPSIAGNPHPNGWQCDAPWMP